MAALSIEDVLAAVNELRRDMQAQITALRSELEEVRARQLAAASEIDHETLVIMAAVVTSYLGKKVRIRSATRSQLAPVEQVSAWAQHGRNVTHASHHLPHAR